MIKEIERLYKKVSADGWSRHEWSKESKDWERYTDALPQEVWIMSSGKELADLAAVRDKDERGTL